MEGDHGTETIRLSGGDIRGSCRDRDLGLCRTESFSRPGM